jgi:hypothetical protein
VHLLAREELATDGVEHPSQVGLVAGTVTPDRIGVDTEVKDGHQTTAS